LYENALKNEKMVEINNPNTNINLLPKISEIGPPNNAPNIIPKYTADPHKPFYNL
jgi:hypothetical protein